MIIGVKSIINFLVFFLAWDLLEDYRNRERGEMFGCVVIMIIGVRSIINSLLCINLAY